MNIRFSILLIFFLLTSCTKQKQTDINLFNNIIFKLNENENLVDIHSSKKNLYNNLVDNVSIQIPLFKCISADDYIIFLGIPVNATTEQFSKDNLLYRKNKIKKDSIVKSHFEIKNKSRDYFSTSFIREFDKNKIYVLAISNSEFLTDSLFNKKKLNSRFINRE
jgi:hypothetical protein